MKNPSTATSREPRAMSFKKQIWDFLLRLSPSSGLGGVAARWVKSGELRVKSNLGTSLKFQATRQKTSTRQSKIYNLKSCALNHQRLVRGVIYTIAFTLIFQTTAPAFALTTSIDFTNTSDYTLEDSTKVELSEGKLQLSGGDTTETVEDVFSTYLFDSSNAISPITVNNGINLDTNGGMVWTKGRDVTLRYNTISDTERGPGNKLFTDSTSENLDNEWDNASEFNEDGFVYKDGYGAVSKQVSWTFREAPGFFDIVTYAGNGTTSNVISHSLDAEPGMIIVKRTDIASDWVVYHKTQSNMGFLNYTNPFSSAQRFSSITNTDFTIGVTTADVNSGGGTYVAYLFAHDPSEDGKIQCGSYVESAGLEINLGWEPQYILMKGATINSNWSIWDSMRGLPVGEDNPRLAPNLSNSESPNGPISPSSTGFIHETGYYGAGETAIYCAIRAPQKEPVNSSEVFAIDTAGNTEAPLFDSGFPVDMALHRGATDSSSDSEIYSRITGVNRLYTDNTAPESNVVTAATFDFMNGWRNAAYTDLNDYSWMFKRAPGFFDVVAYEGDGVAGRTLEHNLGVAPEMMIVKRRDGTQEWYVYNSTDGATKFTYLNDNVAAITNSNAWSDTEPTTSAFTLNTALNGSSNSYISYLFATVPDVSKVGSYTGTASDLDIDAGFTNGTKFVLIKRTDSTGDWYLYDVERGILEGNDPYLLLNTTDAEVTGTDYIDPIDSGFRITSSAPAALNASGGEYIYLAIANDNGKARGAYPTDKAYTATTNTTTQIDSSTWADINSVSVTETVPAQTTETPEAVDFDGENDYLSRSSDLVGNQDSKTFTFSAWVYPVGDSFFIYQMSSGRFAFYGSTDNSATIIGYNTSWTKIFQLGTIPAKLPRNTFSHILISVDLSDINKKHFYLNDSEVIFNPTTYINDSIDFTQSNHYFATNYINTVYGNQRLSHTFFDHTYRDLSQEANRRLFITEDGKPANGQEDLNPILYLPLKSAETAGQNLGTGGDFTVNGTLSTSERGPNQYNASASKFDGSDYLSKSSITGMTDGKLVTVSFAGVNLESDTNGIMEVNNNVSNSAFWLYFSGSSGGYRLSFYAKKADGTLILSARTQINETVVGKLLQGSISLDMDNQNNLVCYINGIQHSLTVDLFSTGEVIWLASQGFIQVGNGINNWGLGNVVLSNLYFDTSYLSLSQNNPFWNSNENKPAYLGQNGELPTGSAPLIYLPLRADDAGKNLGTGGDFTVNGALEGARGPSEFWANSAEFDGSTGYLSRANTLNWISDGQQFSLVFNAKRFGTSGTKEILTFKSPTTNSVLDIYVDNQNLKFFLKLANNSEPIRWETTNNSFVGDSWNTVMLSVDTSLSTSYRLYINNTVPSIYTTSDTQNTILPLSELATIWHSSFLNTYWNNEIGFAYFTTDYIDFSQKSNRLKFVDALGNPKYIGQNGELPTGSAPLIYMSFKDADNLGYNAGTGGDFTVNGTVTLGSGGPFPNEPTNVNTYAHYAVSFDGRTSFAAFDSAQAAWRSIARDNAGTWEYNSAASGSESWIACSTNTPSACLSEATALEANQMTGTEFIAISDTDWEATGGFESLTTNTIDVAVSLQSESTTMTPNVDIVTFDYDPILNIAPNDPILNNYNSGATITDTTPTLSFDLSDPDESEEGEEIKYQLQIDNNADFASPEVDFTELAFTTSPRTSTEYTASGLSDGQWYWRVKAIDDDGLESNWSEASNGFKIDISLPESKILYPQDGASLKNVNYIFGRSTDSQGVDKTRISILNLTTGKYYTGTGFTADAETWIDTNPTGANQTRTRWWIAAPTWADFQTYTIRSRAIDMAGNEEHTDAITFTYDTVNGSEGSLYVSNPGVDNNSDYTIFYPNTDPLATGDYIEIDFDDTFAFSPWLEDSDVTLSDNGGNITGSSDSFDRLNKTITSTITGGNVTGGDIIELAVSNLKIHNPSATWSYALPIRIYNSSDILIEAGTGTITLVENYRQVEVNVNIAESLQLRVDSGSVLLEVDPDVQLGQNWTWTGGAVAEKTEVEVKTNAQGGYNLLISLAGNTATGSAVLDGQTLSGSQINSTTGNRVSIENNFTFGVNSGTAATVTAFNNASTQVSGAGSSNATNSYIDNIFYYLNIDYTTPADTYAGTVTYTAVGQF